MTKRLRRYRRTVDQSVSDVSTENNVRLKLFGVKNRFDKELNRRRTIPFYLNFGMGA